MVKKGYILSESDRTLLSQTVAKVNGSPLTPSKLNRRHRDQPAGGSSEYSGFFKVIDASETKDDGTKTLKVKVVDGADRGSKNCGYAWINNTRLQIPSVEKNVSNTGFVYLRVAIPDSGAITEDAAEIVVLSGPPDVWYDSSYTLIARVYVKDNVMRIIQEQHGEIHGFLWGSCS